MEPTSTVSDSFSTVSDSVLARFAGLKHVRGYFPVTSNSSAIRWAFWNHALCLLSILFLKTWSKFFTREISARAHPTSSYIFFKDLIRLCVNDRDSLTIIRQIINSRLQIEWSRHLLFQAFYCLVVLSRLQVYQQLLAKGLSVIRDWLISCSSDWLTSLSRASECFTHFLLQSSLSSCPGSQFLLLVYR